MSRKLNQGMGGRMALRARAIHSFSDIPCTASLKLAGYVVPQGPWNPTRLPVSHSLSGT
jgi:hypothetical protein